MTRNTGRLRNRAAERAGTEIATRPTTQIDEGTARVAGEIPNTVRNLIESMAPEISRTLPKHIGVERMTRVALTLMRSNPELQQCHPASFIGALLTCAQLGVEPGPLGHAYIVPFRNKKTGTKEATFILGYKGMIDLARRSGKLHKITAHTVYQREIDEGRFKVLYGSDERLHHDPMLFGERGPAVAYYAIAWIEGQTEPIFQVLSAADVDKFRRRSPTQREQPSGPWVTDFQAMAWKTCVRRLGTWLPQSVEYAAAVGNDDTVRYASAGQIMNVVDMPAPPREDGLGDVDTDTLEAAPDEVDQDQIVDGDVVDTDTGEITPEASTDDTDSTEPEGGTDPDADAAREYANAVTAAAKGEPEGWR